MGRIVVLTEGHTEPHHGKTAASILRYRGEDVLALIDSTQAGRTAGELLGVGGGTPIVAGLEGLDAQELLIGVAPRGLDFPPAWRRIILEAIDRGMNVVNGTHTFLEADPEFVARARRTGVALRDVRKVPPGIGCSADEARRARPIRVHSVGTDCAIGKMTVTIELDRAFRSAGRKSRFLATGQTGMMISGYGLPIDRMIADFVAGGAEWLVLDNLDQDYLFIEGQGSLYHPLYSGVTLGLLHGCAPDFLILCDASAQPTIGGFADRPKPPLAEAVRYYEMTASIIHPCRVVGIGCNTYGLSEGAAREAIERAEAETGLPATDVLRFGVEKLVAALLQTPRPSGKA